MMMTDAFGEAMLRANPWLARVFDFSQVRQWQNNKATRVSSECIEDKPIPGPDWLEFEEASFSVPREDKCCRCDTKRPFYFVDYAGSKCICKECRVYADDPKFKILRTKTRRPKWS
jgi:hypothetical protein